MRRTIAALAWLLCALGAGSLQAAAPAPAPMLEATVTRVIDGDSLWLAPAGGGAPLEVRLQDIDAPEICQPWGPEARDALQDLVLDKPVQARLGAHDTHGRTLATLFVDGLKVNQVLVKEGHAWSARYKHDRGPYVAEERMATALGRGFNRAGGAVMPRDFRRDHGPCQVGEPARPATPGSAPVPVAAAVPAPAAPAAPAFRCDGRTYCSQMHSCAEATFFLKNCPGVKMDGNGDGVPCEQQWCRR